MSANANAMGNLQAFAKEFLGGGIAVQTPNGGFSTTLDPGTGTYKTAIATKNIMITTGGLGQSPLSFWNQLTSTTSGQGGLILIGIVVIALVFFMFRGRG